MVLPPFLSSLFVGVDPAVAGVDDGLEEEKVEEEKAKEDFFGSSPPFGVEEEVKLPVEKGAALEGTVSGLEGPRAGESAISASSASSSSSLLFSSSPLSSSSPSLLPSSRA